MSTLSQCQVHLCRTARWSVAIELPSFSEVPDSSEIPESFKIPESYTHVPPSDTLSSSICQSYLCCVLVLIFGGKS